VQKKKLAAKSWQFEADLKTLLRTLLYLALIVWLGAEIFFPVVAAITFTTLRPDTHTAGQIVGQLLRILHGMGMVSGMVALALLALAPACAGADDSGGADDCAHRVLAVRHYPRHGARPHCRGGSNRRGRCDRSKPHQLQQASCLERTRGRDDSVAGRGYGGARGGGGDQAFLNSADLE